MTARSTHAEVPEEIQSPRAKLVYLSLAAGGPANVDELQSRLSTTKLTLYGVLGTLSERGLVERKRGRYAVSSCFAANGPS
ncbi:helix-turn-helix domain-containing protein [Salinigranum salinum]|uniref:helix-turn-helix domain-containing protein n=1 Tax=Salinigranum salinum TaxID=1364937 RepID=UPI001260DE5A|nr:helix-turn-helix domain-containing protein [Salinigranum salinum]